MEYDIVVDDYIIPRVPLYQAYPDDNEYRETDAMYLLLLPPTITHRHWIYKPDEKLKEVLQRVQDLVALWERHILDSDHPQEFEGCKNEIDAKWAVLEDAIAAILFDTYSSSSEWYDKSPRDWYHKVLTWTYDLYEETEESSA